MGRRKLYRTHKEIKAQWRERRKRYYENHKEQVKKENLERYYRNLQNHQQN